MGAGALPNRVCSHFSTGAALANSKTHTYKTNSSESDKNTKHSFKLPVAANSTHRESPMEDEFYCDLLRDYDGKLLEIQLDDDRVDEATSSPRSLVVACSATDISLAKGAPNESPKQPSALGFESEEDEDEWLRFVLCNFDLDAILSELNSSESKENGQFDQNGASILDVSLVDIDCDVEDKSIAISHDSYAEPPREFGELMFPPTPAPVLRPTSWSTGAASIRYLQQLEGLPVKPSTVALLPPPVDFSVECQYPQCTQTAVIMNMCYEHSNLLFAEEQHQEPQTTKTRKKRRRAVFSTGTKKKKANTGKAKKAVAATTKKARKPRAAQSAKKATQKIVQSQGNNAVEINATTELKNPLPPRSRRNRRISYGDAA